MQEKLPHIDLSDIPESLHPLLTTLLAIIERQSIRIQELEAEVVKLNIQLNQNSQNSHRPPSQDQHPVKPKPAFPKTEKRNKGGQLGHTGDTLAFSTTPDLRIELQPTTCACGQCLQGQTLLEKERRQVFDIPVPTLHVTEYTQYQAQCPACQSLCTQPFPDTVKARVQYGQSLTVMTALLNVKYRVPMKAISELYSDFFAHDINVSTLHSQIDRVSDALVDSEKVIQDAVIQASVKHGDETGIRVSWDGHVSEQMQGQDPKTHTHIKGRKTYWLHTVATSLHTYLFVDARRGQKAWDNPQSVFKRLTGWLVHDCWSSYFGLSNVRHALCGAHLLRELQSGIDNGVVWASLLHQYLSILYEQSDFGRGQLPIETHEDVRFGYRALLILADLETPYQTPENGRKRVKQSKERNLLERLQKHESAVLAFAFHQEVPFTNNVAEQSVRGSKVKQKVSGCFRLEDSAKRYARIESFVQTARKQKQNVFQELKNALQGHTFLTHTSLTP